MAFGAKDSQTLKALIEAESYPGPSLIIGYSHCIAHGYDMALGLEHQKLAAESGYWPLYRFDPRRSVIPGVPSISVVDRAMRRNCRASTNSANRLLNQM